MWSKPKKSDLKKIPALGAQDGKHTRDSIVYAHFFLAGMDWFITEHDGEDTFFGFAILFPGSGMAEWGYISFEELKSVKVRGVFEVDFDANWTQRKVSDVAKIVEEGGCW
jgi:hypothetical protein